MTEEYDIWAAWGSEKEQSWETERQWEFARSGVIEPVWDKDGEWPWGSTPGVMRDRRAVGMGHRLLVRKGDRRKQSTRSLCSADTPLHETQRRKARHTMLRRQMSTICIAYCMASQRARTTSRQCKHSQ